MKIDKIEYIDRKTGTTLTEKVPGEAFLKFLFHHPFGGIPLELLVKRKFLSVLYGALMDRGISRRKIRSFVQENRIDMDEAARGVDEFATFNDFFIRKLKPGAREIGAGLVSPADGKVIAFQEVSDWDRFFVKGKAFSLKAFLRDEALAEKYAEGTVILVRLAPADYHRFHFPAAGRISATRPMDGVFYSVSPYAVKKKFEIFYENKREYSILETEGFGDLLICEIGATMVGKIVQTYSPGVTVSRGDEKGYFAFGGSSVLLLLEKGKVRVHEDIINNTNAGYETRVLMGESIGVPV